jgi:hypothetical protein
MFYLLIKEDRFSQIVCKQGEARYGRSTMIMHFVKKKIKQIK